MAQWDRELLEEATLGQLEGMTANEMEALEKMGEAMTKFMLDGMDKSTISTLFKTDPSTHKAVLEERREAMVKNLRAALYFLVRGRRGQAPPELPIPA